MADRLNVYLRDAATLREALRLNDEDRRFAEGGGLIYYVLDANVVRLFTWPSEQTAMLSMFARWLDERTLATTASLTTEYLMSGRLAGQHGPVLVSPEHFEEVLGFVDDLVQRLERRKQTRDEQVEEFARKQDEIRSLARHLAAADLPPARKVETLMQNLPHWFKSIVDDELSAAARLQRCLEGASAICRIDGQQWYFEQMGETDAGVLLQWFDWLKEARLARHDRIGRSRDEALKIERGRQLNTARDARTVATLLRSAAALNEGDDPGARLVFVTADTAIAEAVAQHAPGSPSEPRGSLVIRHPREFTPLFNLSDLSAASTASGERDTVAEVLDRIRLLLDELFVDEPDVPTDQAVERSLAHVGGRSNWLTRRPLESGDIAKTLEDLKSNWSTAVNVANGLSIDLLDRHYQGLFDDLARMVEDQGLIDASLSRILGSLRQLRHEHANLTIDGIFLRLREAGRTMEAPRELRVPLIWRNDTLFDDIIGNQSFNRYLRELAAGRIADDPTDALAQRAGEGRVQLFMSCVCLAARLWQPARAFAENALERLQGDNANRPEALYIAAMAIRFASLDARSYRRAATWLAECVEVHERARQQHRAVRARIEAAALVASAAYQDRWYAVEGAGHIDPIITPSALAGELSGAWRELERAVDILQNDVEDASSEMALTLLLQARVKQCALLSYWQLCTPAVPLGLVGRLPAVREALIRDTREFCERLGPARELAIVYSLVMDVLVQKTPEAHRAAMAELGRATATNLLSTVDRYQYEVLRRELQAFSPTLSEGKCLTPG